MATDDVDDVKLGRALKALRERRRMTQGQIGASLVPAISSQAWQKYEVGERHFTEDKILAALSVMGFSREDLDVELHMVSTSGFRTGVFRGGAPPEPRGLVIPIRGVARMGPQGPQVYDDPAEPRTIDLVQFFGPDADAMELAGESMTGWGESGDVVIFNRRRWPPRGKPCVIETLTGEMLCKFFDKQDGSNLYYRENYPEPRTLHLPLKAIKGVYAVRAKLET